MNTEMMSGLFTLHTLVNEPFDYEDTVEETTGVTQSSPELVDVLSHLWQSTTGWLSRIRQGQAARSAGKAS